MRLRPATALHDYEEDRMSGFGDRQTRRERRAERRERRKERREDRWDRKADRRLERVRRKRQKVRRRLAPVPRRARAAALQPAPTTMPTRRPVLDRAVDWVEDLVDDVDEPFEDELEDPEELTEGIGAWTPLRRGASSEAWGPMVRMGRRLRIQAVAGHRAAVIELKPGLFLVADLPEAVARTEFGLGPLLAPLMLTAARRSMDEPDPGRRSPFARLFRRRQREEPVRYVPVAQPAALPGPSEEGTAMVVAPNVGWADDATVAAAYGCDGPRGRR